MYRHMHYICIYWVYIYTHIHIYTYIIFFTHKLHKWSGIPIGLLCNLALIVFFSGQSWKLLLSKCSYGPFDQYVLVGFALLSISPPKNNCWFVQQTQIWLVKLFHRNNETITWPLRLFRLYHIVSNIDQSEHVSQPLCKSTSGTWYQALGTKFLVPGTWY